ncbi:MAG: hypothetical protein M9916_05290 [Crocinitomicaceae bacterium]|nr:hypothetical protein [Crocinitomicaceae bacterium]
MENYFIKLGLSFTWSKALPYIFLIIIGIGLGLLLFKKLKSTLGKIFALLFMVVPFVVYFIVHPIYEGDFTNEARTIQPTEATSELNGHKLVVISLPGCKYCKQSIEFFKEIKKIRQDIVVEYTVVSEDERNLDFYNEAMQGEFPLYLATNVEALNKIAEGRYPTFVLINDSKPYRVWNNNTFGVMAIDEVVNSFKK